MSTPPPSEYFPGINFNVAFYNAGGNFVTKDYVDSNFLKCTGYAFSRAIATTFNNIVYFNGGFEVKNFTMTNTTTVATDLINMNYDGTNGLRFQQAYNTANNVKYNIIQKSNNVDVNALTFYKGAVGLQINGYGIPNNQMAAGSLAIGNLTQNYGGGTASWNANTAGLLLECADNTEIAIHDSGVSIHSFMYYTTNGNFRFGRNMGHGLANITFSNNATVDNNLVVSGTSQFTGNIGVGTSPSATYKIDVNGTINATNILINGAAIGGSKWTATGSNIYYNSGNVGVGTNNPVNILQVGNGGRLKIANDLSDFSQIGTQNDITAAQTSISVIGPTRSVYPSSVLYTCTGAGNHVYFTEIVNVLSERMRLWSSGVVTIQNTGNWAQHANNFMTAGSLVIGNQTQNYGGQSGAVANIAGLMMECLDSTEIAIHDAGAAIHSFMRYTTNGTFTIGRNMGWGTANVVIPANLNVGSTTSAGQYYYSGSPGSTGLNLAANDGYSELRVIRNTTSGYDKNMYINYAAGGGSRTYMYSNNQQTILLEFGNVYINTNGYTYTGQINSVFYSRSMTNTDYLCYGGNTSLGQYVSGWIDVAYGSFTAFHRCYTNDELYNNDTQENIDLFKNNYMGRVVIATGKIKTDYTRPKEENKTENINNTPLPPSPSISDIEVEPSKPNEPIPEEWYTAIDKDGITIEDAVPVVALSRKKKDKRVFGVLGEPTRKTNNTNRLIVNSIGEGAICVANTNGNIENGDYIQSSELLGYGEKQDDDLLHNYTIAKSTINCAFELDSPYYQCHEIENGIRVAFIACSYHCG